MTALGVRGNPDNSLAAVLDYLRPRQMLLILDNCEHVLPAATIFAGRFMADTSSSKLLATSREPLGTTTEHVVRLGSLPSPRSGHALTVDQAVRFPAVQLFVRRAANGRTTSSSMTTAWPSPQYVIRLTACRWPSNWRQRRLNVQSSRARGDARSEPRFSGAKRRRCAAAP